MIRDYRDSDEPSWLRCRVLGFLDTCYYDDVHTSSTVFEHPAIRLVDVTGEEVNALLDVEIFPDEDGTGPTATIDCLAVHPDRRREGLATGLLDTALTRLPGDVLSLDAWTREDPAANAWYQARGFTEHENYLHVYKGFDEPRDGFGVPSGLRGPLTAFCHASRDQEEQVRRRFRRVYVCRQYLRPLRS